MEVVWSEQILQQYFKVIDYLLESGTVKSIHTFENNFDKLIERILLHTK